MRRKTPFKGFPAFLFLVLTPLRNSRLGKLPGDRQKRVPWAKGLRGFFPLADSLKSIKVSEFRAPRVMSKNMGPMPAVSIPKVD
jgi:hypothetical protein